MLARGRDPRRGGGAGQGGSGPASRGSGGVCAFPRSSCPFPGRQRAAAAASPAARPLRARGGLRLGGGGPIWGCPSQPPQAQAGLQPSQSRSAGSPLKGRSRLPPNLWWWSQAGGGRGLAAPPALRLRNRAGGSERSAPCLAFAEVWPRQCGGFPSWPCGGRGGGAGGGSPPAARSRPQSPCRAQGARCEAKRAKARRKAMALRGEKRCAACRGLSRLQLGARTGSGAQGRGGFPPGSPLASNCSAKQR